MKDADTLPQGSSKQTSLREVHDRVEETTLDKRSSLRIKWDTFWSFAGPAFTAMSIVLGLAQYYWPAVTLTTGANLDPHQLFQTQFIITNIGHAPVYDVTFVCDLVSNAVLIAHEAPSNNLGKIDVLLPNHPASRGCFQKSMIINGPWLKVTAAYRWPLFGWQDSETAFFSAKQTANGEVQLV